MEIKIYRAVNKVTNVPLSNWGTDKSALEFYAKEWGKPFFIEEAEFVPDRNPYEDAISSIKEMCEKYGDFSDERASDFLNNVRVKCKDVIEYALKHVY